MDDERPSLSPRVLKDPSLLTVADIERELAEITGLYADDPVKAHILEDDLAVLILTRVAEGHPEARDFARVFVGRRDPNPSLGRRYG